MFPAYWSSEFWMRLDMNIRDTERRDRIETPLHAPNMCELFDPIENMRVYE